MDNRTKLYETALLCLGKDMAPLENDFGCAEAVNAVFYKAFNNNIGGGLSTYWMHDILKHDERFEKNFSPLPGDIVISPTGYGNKKKLRNGHVGIVAEGEQIMSNNSITGLWEKNYTLVTWTRRYKIFGGYPMEFFRVKTPPMAPTAPTIPVLNTAKIEVTPPLVSVPSWMSNFLYRTKATLGFADPMFGGVPRSSGWNNLRNNFINIHPFCEACGVKAETVHHCIPYHEKPELELQMSNLISLCDECHLVLAHLKNFKRYDKDIREVAKLFKAKVDNFS